MFIGIPLPQPATPPRTSAGWLWCWLGFVAFTAAGIVALGLMAAGQIAPPSDDTPFCLIALAALWPVSGIVAWIMAAIWIAKRASFLIVGR